MVAAGDGDLEAADRDAMLAGIADGTVDAVATDHAPHTPAEKDAWMSGQRPEHARIVVLRDANKDVLAVKDYDGQYQPDEDDILGEDGKTSYRKIGIPRLALERRLAEIPGRVYFRNDDPQRQQYWQYNNQWFTTACKSN